MEALTFTQQQHKQQYWDLITDVLSQAITGELVGMSNFASLVATIDDPEEMMEAVEHADSERGHAFGFIKLAEKYKLKVNVNLKANYWRRVRESFLKWADQKDFIACLLIQEVMLESFAVGMYREVGKSFPDDIGQLFINIATEEEGHLEHSIDLLKVEMQRNPEAFIQKVEMVHQDCMTILAEWSAKKDGKGHCEICKGNCMKESLYLADLEMSKLRGNSMALYLDALDRIGLPGEKTIAWIANLPV